MATPLLAFGAGLENTPVSAFCNNITLSSCVQKLAETNNIRIIMPKSMGDRVVKLSVASQSLGQFIQTTLAVLNFENVIVQYNESNRSVTLSLFGDAHQEQVSASPSSTEVAAPPATAAVDPTIAPVAGDPQPMGHDSVVLPPANPGEAPVTVRNLIEMEKREQLESASPSMVVLPPDEKGHSLTIGEFWNSVGQPETPGSIAAVPPGDADGQIVTGHQLSESAKNEAAAQSKNMEIIPPEPGGKKGVTLQEMEDALKKPPNP